MPSRASSAVTCPTDRGPHAVPPATANTTVRGDDITRAVEVTDLLPVRYIVTDY